MHPEILKDIHGMQKNLVIVESPAKAKTIEKFLGHDYKVMSSYGHIRDLSKKELGINLKSLTPEYEIPADKQQVVRDLKSSANKAEKVWLASDEDREGEAIAWHLCEVLGLDEEKTSRIVFHEITKSAILEAIENPRHIDMNLVDAQQARRVLDRLVGFSLSPVLWKKVKPALSAGRVQSVAVRLIVEREREIQAFKSEEYYKVSAILSVKDPSGSTSDVRAEASSRFKSHEEALNFLETCKNATFTVESIQKKPLKRMPAPPFTTSTLQQEAARKLGFTVSQTMAIAQRLYEEGHITYMRTDSVNLSHLCLGASKKEIENLYGDKYSRPRQFHTQSKGAQEAHEAIRPTDMRASSIEVEGSTQDKRLYELIWKRTIASQMAEAEIEKTTATISISGTPIELTASGEVIKFDGFIKVYHESTDDDDSKDQTSYILPELKEGQLLENQEITAVQRFTQAPQRYSEAGLVHKLEELGIGRPSTYAPTISTIQQRDYVKKGDKKGIERQYTVDTLKGNKISHKTKSETAGSDKGKLLPTDIGMVVNDYLMANFPGIMDYNFTASIERKFDNIAEGGEKWTEMMSDFYKDFEPSVDKALNKREDHKAGERLLGSDPATGKPVSVKIGRFGPMAQIGSADDSEKPRFAQIPPDKSLETITLDETLALFSLPRTLGNYEGNEVSIGNGRFGPYVKHSGKYVSLPKGEDPFAITLDRAIDLIEEKRQKEAGRHLRKFDEDPKMEIMDGRFGPYIVYDGNNYRIPKASQANVGALTYEQCLDIVKTTKTKPKKPARRR